MLAGVMRGETVLSPALANLVLSEFAPEAADGKEDITMLTARQREVPELVARGLSNKEVAGSPHVSEATIKYDVSQFPERPRLQSWHQMTAYTQERGSASPLEEE